MKKRLADAKNSFIQIAKIAGYDKKLSIEMDEVDNEHGTHLPKGKVAVYSFFYNKQCLKVGKSGKKSQARYAYQHYNPNSSNSNLAKSMQRERKIYEGLTKDNSRAWITKNTDRYNYLLEEDTPQSVVNLFEAFLQCSFNPRYEGAGNKGLQVRK